MAKSKLPEPGAEERVSAKLDAPASAAEVRLFFEPAERLRLTVLDRGSHLGVRPVWSAPLSRPKRYLALLDSSGDEIITFADPNELDADSRMAVEEELYRRYLSTQILAIVDAKVVFGATYWTVETDRGRRDLVTQSLQENAVWLAPSHLLLVDVDGNRFEIPSVTALDERSRQYVEAIL